MKTWDKNILLKKIQFRKQKIILHCIQEVSCIKQRLKYISSKLASIKRLDETERQKELATKAIR